MDKIAPRFPRRYCGLVAWSKAPYCPLLGTCPAFVRQIGPNPLDTLLIDTDPSTTTTLIEKMEPMKG